MLPDILAIKEQTSIYNSNQKTLKKKLNLNKQIHHAHANTENIIVFSNEDSKMNIAKERRRNRTKFSE